MDAVYTYIISKGLTTIYQENPEFFNRIYDYVKCHLGMETSNRGYNDDEDTAYRGFCVLDKEE